MEEKLLSYQIPHVKNLLKSLLQYSRALDASDTGTGKTYSTVALCKELGLRPFVICPLGVIPTWYKTFYEFEFEDEEFDVFNYESLLHCPLISKINDNYVWNFNKDEHGGESKYIFIFDEAHRCKNTDTIASKILISLASHDTKILLLSATIFDKIHYFLPFGLVLGLYETLSDGAKYLQEVANTNKSRNLLEKLHNKIFPMYASRMKIDDLAHIFKENNVSFEGIKMDNHFEIEEQYDAIEKIDKTDKTNLCKKKIKNQIKCIHQNIEFMRVDSICKATLEDIAKGFSVVIFINFTKTLEELCRRLNTKCVVYGKQTLTERSKNVDDFNSDLSRIIILNIQSGGTGISLHDTHGNFPRKSIISPTWSAQDLIQALGRIHRATGKTIVEQRIFYCIGTIEENIGTLIKQKILNIRMFNNGTQHLKNDNMKNIIKIEQSKRKKITEKQHYIYQTNDFDSIQHRLGKLDYELTKYTKQLLKLNDETTIEYKELIYLKNKIIKEINFNKECLTICVNKLIDDEYN